MEFNESINVKDTITNDCDAKGVNLSMTTCISRKGLGFDVDTLDEFIKLLREQRDIIESRMNAETTAELFDGEKSD